MFTYFVFINNQFQRIVIQNRLHQLSGWPLDYLFSTSQLYFYVRRFAALVEQRLAALVIQRFAVLNMKRSAAPVIERVAALGGSRFND